MIPANVDMNALEKDVADNGVAVGSLGTDYPQIIPDLENVIAYAKSVGFGDLCIVHVEPAPEKIADHRDIAETILRDTECTTVIARSARGGDIVSEDFSRKAIETYQFDMIGDPDYVGSVRVFVDNVNTHYVPWMPINIGFGILVVIAFALAFITARKSLRSRTRVTDTAV